MNPIRVAVVDDHEMFRKGIIGILDDSEWIDVVLEAADGADFLEGLRTTQVEVALLDLEMPGMNGMDACREAHEQYPDLKILILTMHKSPHFMTHMMENGANGYLVKESGPDELTNAIRTVHESGYYFSDALSKAMLQRLSTKKPRNVEQLLNNALSAREREVLELICQEMTTPEIAEKLFLSPRTVEGYRKQLLEKSGTRNTAGLVLWAVREGMVE